MAGRREEKERKKRRTDRIHLNHRCKLHRRIPRIPWCRPVFICSVLFVPIRFFVAVFGHLQFVNPFSDRENDFFCAGMGR
jgi:hypothetical protein